MWVLLSLDAAERADGCAPNLHSHVLVQSETALLNLYVKPEAPVVSYLNPLTGLSEALLQEKGVPLADALATLRSHLPREAHLVGQSIGTDCRWLGLVEGTDFAGLIDLAGLFRVWNPQYKSWSVFGQDHLCRVLLGVDGGTEAHNAVTDAQKSMRLFNLHTQSSADAERWKEMQAALLAAPQQPSFARRFPVYEGVCMGNRKACSCGAAFLFS